MSVCSRSDSEWWFIHISLENEKYPQYIEHLLIHFHSYNHFRS